MTNSRSAYRDTSIALQMERTIPPLASKKQRIVRSRRRHLSAQNHTHLQGGASLHNTQCIGLPAQVHLAANQTR